MATRLMPLLATCLLVCGCCSGPGKAMSAGQESRILAFALARELPDGGYTVVLPRTTFSPLDVGMVAGSREAVLGQLQIEGCDVGRLFDLLMERNREPLELTLESSAPDGYVIDYDGTYSSHFAKGGGGWDRWYQDDPKARGLTRVSRPAYDPESGIVLIYMGTQSHWLAGSGGIVAFRYDGSRLKEVGRVMLWIS